MLAIKKFVFFFIIIFFYEHLVFSSELYELKEWDKKTSKFDEHLVSWIENFNSEVDLSAISENDLKKITKDKLDQFFLRLYAVNKKYKWAKTDQKDYDSFLESPLAKIQHPLLPYIFEQLMIYYEKKPEIITKIKQKWMHDAGISCPMRRNILNRFSEKNFFQEDVTEAKFLIKKLHETDDFFREKSLRRALNQIKNQDLNPYMEDLQDLVDPFSNLKVEYPWVIKSSEEAFSSRMDYKLLLLEEQSKRKNCLKAKNDFLKFLDGHHRFLSLEEAEKKASILAKCFKSKDSHVRVNFWQSIQPSFSKYYKEKGQITVLLNIAKIFWYLDRYDDAQKELDKAEKIALSFKDHAFLARVLELKGRVKESKQDFVGAFEAYKDIIDRYPEFVNPETVIRPLIIISIGQKNWKNVLEYTSYFVAQTIDNEAEETSSNQIGFAFFWMARAQLELNLKEEAELTLKRVVIDLPSSYYGAISQYLLERLNQKHYSLVQGQSKPFKELSITDVFDGLQKNTIYRAEKLFRFGLKEDALCEIKNLHALKENPQQLYAKSLLYHASGGWLDAIKIYMNLPKAYRQHLPSGSELVLFPKKYADVIDFYSEKAKVDADFITALIRQESVFNPYSTSVAGARGLMQLMKNTAVSEAKKLKRGYLPASEKKFLVQAAKRVDNLYDPKISVALGVHYIDNLLERYDNTAFALAAYNAGPGALRKWTEKYPTEDLLYFIELIPYQETRDYVKLIIRNYFYYKRWYREKQTDLPYMDRLFYAINR